MRDFVSTHLSDHISHDQIPTVVENESVSAEAMMIASTFRKVNLPQRDMHPNGYSWRILNEVTRIETETLPTKRPKLKPAIKEQIQRASVDYAWLKNERGLAFEGLDYAAFQGADIEPDVKTVRLEDIIEIDWERYDLLLYKLLDQEMKRGFESSLEVLGIDFRISNFKKNARKLKAKARALFSG